MGKNKPGAEKERTKNKRWVRTFYAIRQRCNNPNYYGYHRYGGRGIQCHITKDELMILWFRYGADKMNNPSIDRINNDGDYTFENCQYIENRENPKKRCNTLKKNCPHGHPYSGANLYILRTGGRERRVCRTCARKRWRDIGKRKRQLVANDKEGGESHDQ